MVEPLVMEMVELSGDMLAFTAFGLRASRLERQEKENGHANVCCRRLRSRSRPSRETPPACLAHQPALRAAVSEAG